MSRGEDAAGAIAEDARARELFCVSRPRRGLAGRTLAAGERVSLSNNLRPAGPTVQQTEVLPVCVC